MASIVRAMDLAELTASADQIVIADVISMQSTWDGGHRTIHTTIDLHVQERWKGVVPGDGRMQIRQLGGRVGDIEMSVYGMPGFAPSERVLLFLRRAEVVGMSQGKRRLRWDTAGKRWLAEAPDRTHVLEVDTQGRRRAAVAGQPEIVDRLREQVRTLVGN